VVWCAADTSGGGLVVGWGGVVCKGLSQQFLGKAISSENFLETTQLELSGCVVIHLEGSVMHAPQYPTFGDGESGSGICTSIGVWGLCMWGVCGVCVCEVCVRVRCVGCVCGV